MRGVIGRRHNSSKPVKRFADFKPGGVSQAWTHSVVNVRHLLKDYGLPFALTFIFLILVLIAVAYKSIQKTSLANLLSSTTTVNQDYDSLISADTFSDAVVTQADDENDSQAPLGTPTSTTFNSGSDENDNNSPSQPLIPNNGGTNPNPNPDPGTDPDPQPTPKFAASISSFQKSNEIIDCPGPQILKASCTIHYEYTANVSTQNGPGNVTYSWRSTAPGVNEDSQYEANSGQQVKTIKKTVSLSCREPNVYNIQFLVNSPTQVSSATLTINHNCS